MAAAFFALPTLMHPQTIDASRLPPPARQQVDFQRDIEPILEASCVRCHGGDKPKSRFRLDTREGALRGGANNRDDIVPGDSGHSRLIQYVSGLVPDMQMPPPDKGKPLTGTQIGLLRAWVDQGVLWGAPAGRETEISATPILRWTAVKGNGRKFREIEGIKEGWAGGLDQFSWREQPGPGETFSGEGRAILRDDDFSLRMAFEKEDLAYLSAGFEQWRKYYDATGGFAPLLPTNSFSLNRDLSLRIGRAWADVGLLLPDAPRVVAGYEYQFRQGSEATLQWGPVGTMPLFARPTDAKNVYPAFKDIDEATHIVKLDVTHQGADWRFENNGRLEFYRLATTRQDRLDVPSPETFSRASEHAEYTVGSDTVSLTKALAKWLSVSTAYFYSQLDGKASLTQNTYNSPGVFAFGDQWFGNDINMSRVSQAASVAAIAGPAHGFSLSLGAQGDWTRQRTMGFSDLQQSRNPNLPPLVDDSSPNTGNLESASVRETVSARYTSIPRTVLFAEARLRQESFSRYENRPEGLTPFTYDADEGIQSEEYRAGFNTSPWSRFSFSADVKHTDKHTDYIRLFDSNTASYPGFFNWRDIDGNQAQARVVYRAAAWLRTSVNVRFEKTDFDGSQRAVDPGTPGGEIEAADYQARSYSFNAVLTPFSCLYLSSTFSYSDSRLVTARNGADYLAPYEGNLYSVISSAGLALGTNTNLRLTHVFSKSDYGQNNLSGLPLGIDFERHAVQAVVTHRFSSTLSGSLGYGFTRYREPTAGGVTDYTANLVFAMVTVAWR